MSGLHRLFCDKQAKPGDACWQTSPSNGSLQAVLQICILYLRDILLFPFNPGLVEMDGWYRTGNILMHETWKSGSTPPFWSTPQRLQKKVLLPGRLPCPQWAGWCVCRMFIIWSFSSGGHLYQGEIQRSYRLWPQVMADSDVEYVPAPAKKKSISPPVPCLHYML